ncbi:MAG: hypothetical protein HQM10_25915 [Candidatus Riflebacteria bacterium]|nr:hypothetical protein [Candidatus Riflebacteria bacterium]
MKSGVDSEKYDEAHVQLEKMVAQMNLLSCLPDNDSIRLRICEAELVFLDLRPSNAPADKVFVKNTFFKFQGLIEKIDPENASSGSLLETIKFRALDLADAIIRNPGNSRGFAVATAEFERLRVLFCSWKEELLEKKELSSGTANLK